VPRVGCRRIGLQHSVLAAQIPRRHVREREHAALDRSTLCIGGTLLARSTHVFADRAQHRATQPLTGAAVRDPANIDSEHLATRRLHAL
jgi:hypothetical protein